jgi:hypothetical protein
MTKTPDKRVESTLWKLRVLAGNGREKSKNGSLALAS